MQNISRNCNRRVLPGKRHSGRTLYAKAQSEPYAREENTTAAGLPATQKKQSAPAILSSHCRASLLDLRMACASNCRSPEPIGQQPVELASELRQRIKQISRLVGKQKETQAGNGSL